MLRLDRPSGPPNPTAALFDRAEDPVELLHRHGALLLPDAGVRSPADLADLRRALGWHPAQSLEPFAARDDLSDGVYSWPKWGAHREMCLHHEQSYGVDYPEQLLMAAVGPAPATVLLADTRAVLDLIPAGLTSRIRDEGWMFVRNFLPRLGLPWSEALGAPDPSEVERICAERFIEYEWMDGGILQLRQRRPGVHQHPATGADCWFNDLAFMSQWSMAAADRDVLLGAFGPFGIPFNTRLGSGDPLPQQDFQTVMDAYAQTAVVVTMQPGDLLLVDNLLTAHGRGAYQGGWDLVTALAQPHTTDRLTDAPPNATPLLEGATR